MSVTEEIKSRLDIVDIIGESVQLRKSGRSHTGFCPFHSNTKSPAFHVFPDTQTWYCFGACAEGGDLFSYTMKKENMEFRDALEYLAGRAGVTLESYNKPSQEQEEAASRELGLLASAADYFHQLLRHAPEAEFARKYVAGRDLTDGTIDEFKLGFALNKWDACKTHFEAQGYSQDELIAAGLLTENEERKTVYDRFRNRFIIPIHNLDGHVVGFGARTLEKDGIPKYLNSPQGRVFDKGRLLFGLHEAKRHIREARQVVIVEGYMDVIRAWQAGFRNVVAQMGTALTNDQLNLLKRYTKRFVLALDADDAGINATMRSLNVARETLDRQADFAFDATGLVRQEGRLQADIRVVTMPPGEDPDDVIRADPARWPQLLEQAKPVVSFVIETLTQGEDLRDPKRKTEVARQILPLIGDVAEPLERDHYRNELARVIGVDERALRQLQADMRGANRRTTVQARPQQRKNGRNQLSAPAFNGTARRQASLRKRETNYLRQCLENPALIKQVDQRMHVAEQPQIGDDDFSLAEDKVLLRHLRLHVERGTMEDIDTFAVELDDALQSRIHHLLNMPAMPPDELHSVPDKLALSLLDCRLERIKAMRQRASELLREASQQNDEQSLQSFMRQQVEIATRERQINRAKYLLTSVSQRDK